MGLQSNGTISKLLGFQNDGMLEQFSHYKLSKNEEVKSLIAKFSFLGGNLCFSMLSFFIKGGTLKRKQTIYYDF